MPRQLPNILIWFLIIYSTHHAHSAVLCENFCLFVLVRVFCLFGEKKKRLCDSIEFIVCQILFADRGGRVEQNTISLNALFLVFFFFRWKWFFDEEFSLFSYIWKYPEAIASHPHVAHIHCIFEVSEKRALTVCNIAASSNKRYNLPPQNRKIRWISKIFYQKALRRDRKTRLMQMAEAENEK